MKVKVHKKVSPLSSLRSERRNHDKEIKTDSNICFVTIDIKKMCRNASLRRLLCSKK
ncbi:MAG: hypothetical protein Q4F95_00725 [Oscillospiraceae bacterium]|nr:hypothetical protein [Oscillospiraceae bacterium]